MTNKTLEKYEKTVLARSLEEDRQHATAVLLQTLYRAESIASSSSQDNGDFSQHILTPKDRSDKLTQQQKSDKIIEAIEKENRQRRFIKRWALLLALGGLKISDKKNNEHTAKDLNMPVSQIIAGGSRVGVITLSDLQNSSSTKVEKNNMIAQWLLSPEEATPNIQNNYNKILNIDPNENNISGRNKKKGVQIVHTRGGASHRFKKDGKTEHKIRFSAVKLITWYKYPKEALHSDGRHLGVDLAIGAFSETTIAGKPITMDGLTGHAYMHVDPNYGSILLGIEACTEPKGIREAKMSGQFSDHTLLSAKDKITAFGTIPWGSYPKNWGKIAIDKRYDCFKIMLDTNAINNITQINPNEFSDEIVTAIPASNPAEMAAIIYRYKTLPQIMESVVDEKKPTLTTNTAQDEVRKAFTREIDSQNNVATPEKPYRGIGIKCNVVQNESQFTCKITEIFSQNHLRFYRIGSEANPLNNQTIKNKFITEVTFTNSVHKKETLNINDLFQMQDYANALSKLATAFHGTGEISFKDSEGNTYGCQKNVFITKECNKTQLPRESNGTLYKAKVHGLSFMNQKELQKLCDKEVSSKTNKIEEENSPSTSLTSPLASAVLTSKKTR